MNILKKWVSEAEHQAWEAGVSKFFWLSLRDWPRPCGLPYSQTIESGLYFRSDEIVADRFKAIPGAFRFPFVAYGVRGGLSGWGTHAGPRPRPGAGQLPLQRNGWHNAGTIRAGANCVFTGLLRTGVVDSNRGSPRATLLGGGAG